MVENSTTRDESQIETDITVYGATGFVAKHVLDYLIDVSNTEEVPRELKVTLSGRNPAKLATVLAAYQDEKSKIKFDILVANSDNDAELKAMASRTRVVINCAGPFALYSSGVVGACADTGCDYVDITGEVNWVGDMRVEHGASAAKSGARIISLCGFDSVPSDISVFIAVESLRSLAKQMANNTERTSNTTSTEEEQQPTKEEEEDTTQKPVVQVEHAKTFHSVFGLAGGGTIYTMQEMEPNLKEMFFLSGSSILRTVPFMMFDPLVLAHPESVRFNSNLTATKNQMALTEWMNMIMVAYPHTIFRLGCSVPFMMAPANAKVVQASAVALNYGPAFTYMERWLPMGFRTTSSNPILSSIVALATMACLVVSFVWLKLPIIGKAITNMFFPPGSGASDTLCSYGYADVYAQVHAKLTVDGETIRRCANCHVSFEGDPGNFVTAQCVTESALTLVLNRTELPPRSVDGFGTPAELLGSALVKRFVKTEVRPVTIATTIKEVNLISTDWTTHLHRGSKQKMN